VRPGAEERDDAALLRGIAGGDDEALAAPYDRHAGVAAARSVWRGSPIRRGNPIPRCW